MTAAFKLAGVTTALITPFDRHGAVDTGAFCELVAMQKMDGAHGVVIAGSTGEGPTVSLAEREELVALARDCAGNHLAVIASAGSNCTKTAVEWQKAMENAGAHATMQVVPYYNKPTQRGLFEHFSAIAKIAKVPVILYNASGRTGIDLWPKTVEAIIKEHDNVVAIKDANVNMERLTELVALTKSIRPDFLVLCGEDSAFLSFLAQGCDGIISVVSHIAAMEMLAIYNAVKNGDLGYAQKIARKINDLCKLMNSHPNPIPLKTILAHMGLIEKSFRLPLCPLSQEEEAILLASLKEYAFINKFKARGFNQ